VAEQSATSIVIPRIAEDFGADIPTAQWLAIGYMICVSALMMPAGAIADTLGRRRVWVMGLVLFAGASLLTAFSVNFWMVLSSKILMGVGASAIQANGMAMVAGAFPDTDRGKAAGLHMTVVGIGAVGGPMLGGAIDSLLDWRAIFVFIAVASVVSAAVAMAVMSPQERQAGQGSRSETGLRGFDWVGTALSAAFLLVAMLAVTFAMDLGWRSPAIVGGFAVSATLFGVFLAWEQRHVSPMLPLSLFRSASFSFGSAARFVSFMASTATFFLMPFFLVSGMGMETVEAALYLMPAAAAMVIFGPFSGRISDRIGTKIPAVVGMVFSTISMYLFSTVTLQTSPLIVAAASGLSGMGMSIFMAPNTSSILGSAGRQHYGIVSAFLNLTRNGAHIVGIAVPTAVVVATMGSLGYDADLSDVDKLGDLGLRSAFASGMARAFQISMFMMFVAMLLALVSPSSAEARAPLGARAAKQT
jgi:EmrB/QacA subfamily drug resistance transporter